MSIIEFIQNPVVGVIGIFGALVFSFLCSLIWEYIKEGKIGADIWKRFIIVFLIIAFVSSLLINVLVLMPAPTHYKSDDGFFDFSFSDENDDEGFDSEGFGDKELYRINVVG